jgi:hypothetical protein
LAAATRSATPPVEKLWRWSARRQLAADLLRDVRALDQRITSVQERIQAAVKDSKTTLVEQFGVGPVPAAKFLGCGWSASHSEFLSGVLPGENGSP